ncbi:MAG: hypothetical protein KGI72_05390 [Patescibacteria group bacterium]|nr:hypothetical protein [Patescibacteria group bacterium]MDE2233094.1 hypothetical protein [Patescibacteria group bacterium]
MKSYTDLTNLFNTLSLNTAPSNNSLAGILLNDRHRYLLQKYFDNEASVFLRTVGPSKYSLSSSFAANGATSATLASAWGHSSSQQLTVFSSGEQRLVTYIAGSTTITWQPPLLGSFDGTVTSASNVNNTISYTLQPVSYITSSITNAEAVIFSGASLPGGITAGTTYYFGNITDTTFELYTDSGLTNPVTITSSGTGAFTSVITTSISTMGAQAYLLPSNVSKIKNTTITVGQLVYTPAPVNSIQEWTKLNALPYNSSIPGYFFVWQRQLNFWPIPSDFGDVITINCQIKVADMTYADYSTGTIASSSSGSNKITGTGTGWSSFPTGVDLSAQNLYITITPPGGDGLSYKIQSFVDDTHLILWKDALSMPAPDGASYKIGQYPLLFDDFHDIIVYWALEIYYNSIVKDVEKYQMWKTTKEEHLDLMENYLGTKQVNVDLSVTPVMNNPNLYTYVPPSQ